MQLYLPSLTGCWQQIFILAVSLFQIYGLKTQLLIKRLVKKIFFSFFFFVAVQCPALACAAASCWLPDERSEGVRRNELMDRCLTLLGPAVAVVPHTERLCLGSAEKKNHPVTTVYPSAASGWSGGLELVTPRGSLAVAPSLRLLGWTEVVWRVGRCCYWNITIFLVL